MQASRKLANFGRVIIERRSSGNDTPLVPHLSVETVLKIC